ncbi:excisionase [Collimonas sp. H4R21]|uniref:Excisionase n=1 Tax=Collimonas rhizosphaerae TaxID=3126357 RepID=A0ABU9PQM0_9BURK
MSAIAANIRYTLIPVFCAITGYTDKAVRRKIEDGIWIEGTHYRRAPDGHITMNVEEYYKWVEQGA